MSLGQTGTFPQLLSRRKSADSWICFLLIMCGSYHVLQETLAHPAVNNDDEMKFLTKSGVEVRVICLANLYFYLSRKEGTYLKAGCEDRNVHVENPSISRNRATQAS